MKIFAIALIAALIHGVAYGELVWERQRVELVADPSETFVDATFGVKNAGDTPVTVEELKPSCGCTSVSMPNMTVQPGERSEVKARFNIGGRRGVQKKIVNVHIKGEEEPVVLTLVVSIPELVEIVPPLVMWRTGAEATSKTIRVRAKNDYTVKITDVVSSAPLFEAKLETIQEGQQYAIVVTPTSTENKGIAVLTIHSERGGQKKNLRAFAQVKE